MAIERNEESEDEFIKNDETFQMFDDDKAAKDLSKMHLDSTFNEPEGVTKATTMPSHRT